MRSKSFIERVLLLLVLAILILAYREANAEQIEWNSAGVRSTTTSLEFPAGWRVTQIVDGWVIYTNSDLEALPRQLDSHKHVVAIRRDTLKGPIVRGSNLLFTPSPPCLKRLKDSTWERQDGFPVKVRRFEASYYCK